MTHGKYLPRSGFGYWPCILPISANTNINVARLYLRYIPFRCIMHIYHKNILASRVPA